MLRIRANFLQTKFYVLIPPSATIDELKNEIIALYCNYEKPLSIPAINNIHNNAGYLLPGMYSVGAVLDDYSIVFATTQQNISNFLGTELPSITEFPTWTGGFTNGGMQVASVNMALDDDVQENTTCEVHTMDMENNVLREDLNPKQVGYSLRKPGSNAERTTNMIIKKIKSKDEEGIEKTAAKEKGWGVRSTKSFHKGEFICEYSGDLITAKEAMKREAEYARTPETGCYMYFFKYKERMMCIDATADNDRHGRLLNHCKHNPNVKTKVVEVGKKPVLCLMALRDIKPGEYLEFDYGDRRKDVIKQNPWLAT